MFTPEIKPPREPNPNVTATTIYSFTLGSRDKTLVLKALGGRLNNDDEVEQARNLCDRLTLQIEGQLAGIYTSAKIAAEHVRRKQEVEP